MKTLKFLLFAMLALSMSMNMTCSDDDTPGQQPDDLREQNLLKSKLLGEWVAPDQENSYVYAFADDDTIYIKSREGDTVSRWPYQAIAKDSIRIVRSWTTHNKVVFYSNDSIWIGDFIPSIAAVYPPEFDNVVLKRLPIGEKEDDTQGQQPDDLRERDLLKSKLLGEWVAPNQENNYTYAFASDDTIYIKNREGDTVSRWPYQAIAEDSIRIVRNWTTHNKVVFYSNDSIWISDFIPIPSVAAVYPPTFGNAVLKRRLNDEMKLPGTKWKLAALVDMQTRESIAPEPKECSKCYTLEFDSDTTATGQSIANVMHFTVTPSAIELVMATEIWEGEDNNVALFYNALLTIDTYEYSKDELKIYYDGKNKYLLYKLLLQ